MFRAAKLNLAFSVFLVLLAADAVWAETRTEKAKQCLKAGFDSSLGQTLLGENFQKSAQAIQSQKVEIFAVGGVDKNKLGSGLKLLNSSVFEEYWLSRNSEEQGHVSALFLARGSRISKAMGQHVVGTDSILITPSVDKWKLLHEFMHLLISRCQIDNYNASSRLLKIAELKAKISRDPQQVDLNDLAEHASALNEETYLEEVLIESFLLGLYQDGKLKMVEAPKTDYLNWSFSRVKQEIVRTQNFVLDMAQNGLSESFSLHRLKTVEGAAEELASLASAKSVFNDKSGARQDRR